MKRILLAASALLAVAAASSAMADSVNGASATGTAGEQAYGLHGVIDTERGAPILSKLQQGVEKSEQYFELHEFATSISAIDFQKMLNATVVANEELMKSKKLYGYTLMESLKIILEMPYSQFPKLYGTMSERAFIFTQVSTGRSPMVVIRVTPMKPSLVVLHGLKDVDPLAVKIAEREKIPVIATNMDLAKIKDVLNKI